MKKSKRKMRMKNIKISTQQVKDKKRKVADEEYSQFYRDFEQRYENPVVIDVKKAFRWFIEYMGYEEWVERRKGVLLYFNDMNDRMYKSKRSQSLQEDEGRLVFYHDWVAWYLYLAESLADRPTVDEPSQSSRIMPFLAMIGKHIDLANTVIGIENKLNDLLVKRINQPDSILFELLVAICYKRNGWEVEFIPESGAGKTPDMIVKRGTDEYFVECKRLAKVTKYSEDERTEWLKRWHKIVPLLMAYKTSVFLEVGFKKEVAGINENMFALLVNRLLASGRLSEGVCLENDEIEICAKHINMRRVQNHFDKWRVRFPSPQLNALFDENFDPMGSYTMALVAKLGKVSPDKESVLNTFADSVKTAFCAKWECIADESIDKKAKDVKNLLVKAVKQAPEGAKTIVHIAYETLHGPHIELVRDSKITKMLSDFDFNGKDIASVFCHSFQPRCFPDNTWDFAETVRYFSFSTKAEGVLHEMLVIQPEGMVQADETHWEQDIREMLNRNP